MHREKTHKKSKYTEEKKHPASFFEHRVPICLFYSLLSFDPAIPVLYSRGATPYVLLNALRKALTVPNPTSVQMSLTCILLCFKSSAAFAIRSLRMKLANVCPDSEKIMDFTLRSDRWNSLHRSCADRSTYPRCDWI